MRLQTYLCMLTFMVFLVGMVTCYPVRPVAFNVTDRPLTFETHSFTNIECTFPTEKTSGVAVYTDLYYSLNEFSSFSMPESLSDYKVIGIYQLDMQKVVLPSGGAATFSFAHEFSYGILNVNPKQLCIVGVDVKLKKFVQIDYHSGSTPFTQKVILPLQTMVYTFGVLGFVSEIPAQFGVPTLVNYRASLKYEFNKNLNQYLSAFVNRPLDYPAHEYVAKLVDNRLALPSNQMIEIASFSFNPMFKPSYNVLKIRDFMFSFNISKGFVDKYGKKVEIDFQSLQCLYVLDENQGFIQEHGSIVFPDWQKLGCSAGVDGIGANDFFPKYVTIVANRGSTAPPQPFPITKPSSKIDPRTKNSDLPGSGAFPVRVLALELIIVVMMIAGLLL